MVKIRLRNQVSYYLSEIGDPIFEKEAPVCAKAKCATCGEGIEDPKMIIGIWKDFPVFLFHKVCRTQNKLFDDGTKGKVNKEKPPKEAPKKKVTKNQRRVIRKKARK